MSFPAIAYHVKLQSMIVQILGGTVSLVSDISGDLAGTSTDVLSNLKGETLAKADSAGTGPASNAGQGNL